MFLFTFCFRNKTKFISCYKKVKVILCLILITISCFNSLQAQNTLRIIVKDSETKDPLTGATASIKETNIAGSADVNGKIELSNIPNGSQTIVIAFVGYTETLLSLNFPIADSLQEQVVLLVAEAEEMEEVIIASTRSSRTIENTPTRIETISGEELEEKGNMKPGDIRMMLNESTGIQTQQTSASSYNSSIRIQGLDGKYTQILKDGLPLYAGFSGGLSLLQIIPLDLKQVEVIKGASSTLYGGGAIAGLVNLISKTPEEKRELNFLLNGTSALGLDASGFYSQKFNKVGTTLFASYNSGKPYDPSATGLTAIPEFERYTINPKLFLYLNDKTTFNIGCNTTLENRKGGDIKYINGKTDNKLSYFEKNTTSRFSSQAGAERILNENAKLTFKNSLNYYERSIEIPNFKFSGIQTSSFSEINYSLKKEKTEWIAGLNLWTDAFSQKKLDTIQTVDYNYNTLGAFIQNTWNATDKFILESGLRGDYHNEFDFFLLPRISALIKANEKISFRLGGGMGYKTPTVFTEEAERIQFRNLTPIDISKIKAEQSVGGNFDINFKTPITEKLFFTLNTLLFYTQVQNPLTLSVDSNKIYQFIQPKGFIDTKGIESNVKLSYENFKLFIGYTYTDVIQHYSIKSDFPLVAKHRLNNVLMYEVEEKLKIGLEAYYFSPQKLSDGKTGKDYWICGFMVEKLWEHFSVFVNFENFLDARQTSFDTIYTGTISNPEFRDIYAPLDGFLVNGGVKIKL